MKQTLILRLTPPAAILSLRTLCVLFLSCFALTSAFSQTRLIAHKSHGGTSLNYTSFSVSGNFGNPPIMPQLKVVEKINDTVVVMHQQYRHESEPTRFDTVYNHPVFSNPNIPVDSLKSTYYPNEEVEFKNFDKKPKVKSTEKRISSEKLLKQEQAKEKKSQKAPKKKKQSTIWLLLIGGAVFLGGGLVSQLVRFPSKSVR